MKVSVIIPSYNHQRYVEGAISSVLQQDFPSEQFELIVIDDGSKDDSANTIERALSRFPDHHTQFFRQENMGVARTLNRGLAMARGEFISLLASDDRLLPHSLQTLVDCFGERGAERACAVFGDGYLIDGDGERIGLYSHRNPPAFIQPVKRELLARNFIPAVGTMYRRSALAAVGNFNPEINIEDWDLLLRLAGRYDFRRTRNTVFEYRIHAGNVSGDRQRMTEMFETFGKEHPDWLSFYRFKQALFEFKFPKAMARLSVRNIGLLTRLSLARVRVFYYRYLRATGNSGNRR